MIKYILFLGIFIAVPVLLRNSQDKKITEVEYRTQAKIASLVESYMKNNKKALLDNVIEAYYEDAKSIQSSEKINNAIWLYHKMLFDEKTPQIDNGKVKVLIFFSDSNLIKPIFEKIDEIKAHIFFRQVATSDQFSAIIARYGYAVYTLKKDAFIPYYLQVLNIDRKHFTYKEFEKIAINLGLNPHDVISVADSKHSEDAVLKNLELIRNLKIDQMPVFVLENGKVFFGQAGFEILKKLEIGA